MIDKKFVNKIVKKVFQSKDRTFSERRVIDPKREWATGLVVGLVVLLLGGWWNLHTYEKFSGTISYSEEVPADMVLYRESLVEAALSDFAERAQKYDSLKNELSGVNRVVVPDPVVVEVESVEREEGSGDTGTSTEEIADTIEEINGSEENTIESKSENETLDETVEEEVLSPDIDPSEPTPPTSAF